MRRVRTLPMSCAACVRDGVASTLLTPFDGSHVSLTLLSLLGSAVFCRVLP
jgi:hypothetical protein